MALSDERRAQLDQILMKMDANGASAPEVHAIVSDFTSKFGQEEKPGGWKGFGETLAESVPSFVRHPSELADVPGAISDLAASHPVGGGAMVPGDVISQFAKDQYEQSQQASQQQADKGNTAGAIGAALPMFGPGAAQAGEEFGRGEVARGLGHTVGLLAPFAAGPLLKLGGKIVNKVAAPFAGSVDAGVAGAAARQGVDLPASALTTSKAVPLVEQAAGKGWFGSKVVQRVDQATARLGTLADETTKSASAMDSSEAGKAVSDGLDRFKNNWIQEKNKLYDAARLPENGITVDAQATRDFLDKVITDKKAANNILGGAKGLPEDMTFFQQLRAKLAKPQQARDILAAKRELDSRIANFNDPITTGNKATLRRVSATLGDELDGAISQTNPDLAQKLSEANAFYKEGLGKINSAFGNSINRLARAGQYDKIAQAVVNSRMSTEDIPRIMEVAGQQGGDGIRSVVLADMFSKARNAEGNLMPASLGKQIQRFGPDRLQAILKPDQYAKLQDIATISGSLQKGAKIAEGSQTAFTLRTMGQVARFMVNPYEAMKLVAGDVATSSFIGSKYGQRWLTSGYRLPAALLTSRPNAGAAGAVLSRAGSSPTSQTTRSED